MRRKAVREPEVKAKAMHGRAMRVSRAAKVDDVIKLPKPKPYFGVVRFNEEKRVFDTGNIKKLVEGCESRPWVEAMELDKRVEAKMRKLFLPSAKDLDAVAEEERIKWLTNGKNTDSGRR